MRDDSRSVTILAARQRSGPTGSRVISVADNLVDGARFAVRRCARYDFMNADRHGRFESAAIVANHAMVTERRQSFYKW